MPESAVFYPSTTVSTPVQTAPLPAVLAAVSVPVFARTMAMSGTKILWGQIIIVFAIVLTTTWAATEWTAWRLGFQPQLGAPWFELAGLAVLLSAGLLLVVVSPTTPMRPPIFIEGAVHRRIRRLHRRSPSRSPCRYGARARRRTSRPTARPAGHEPEEIEGRRPARTRRRRARPLRARLSAP